MEKKVYVLVYLTNGYDNVNASSDVYATKEGAEQALQKERKSLISELDNILPCILAYPYIFNMFIELYKVCLTDNIINSQLVP